MPPGSARVLASVPRVSVRTCVQQLGARCPLMFMSGWPRASYCRLSHPHPCWFSVSRFCQTLRGGVPGISRPRCGFLCSSSLFYRVLSGFGFRFLYFEVRRAHSHLDSILLRNRPLYRQRPSVALVMVLVPERLCLKVTLPLQTSRGSWLRGTHLCIVFTFNLPGSLKQVACGRHVLGPRCFIRPGRID